MHCVEGIHDAILASGAHGHEGHGESEASHAESHEEH
jgi:hypothetical protein